MPNNLKFIAAVSGGPDSMALLDKYHKKIIGVCHVNYHKRDDSDLDEKIVVDYCKSFNIPVAIYNVNKKAYINAKNFQNLARQIRYNFFVKCGKKFKCNNLLIAHNLNDFLETAIMQENRKSLNFFYGIKQRNKFETLNVYRPLIHEFKADLERYCITNKIPYAIDSSNSSDIYERNRIRKELSKFSKQKLLILYKKYTNRNKQQQLKEKKTLSYLSDWHKNNYSILYFKKIHGTYIDSLIYIYLKNNNINNVNYNKIKLVRDFIVSKQSNLGLRLEQGIKLWKKDGRIEIIHKK